MSNLFFPDKSKPGLEQAKIIAIDRTKGRISVALRTGLVTTASYLYNISDLRVGLNVVVGRISGGYVIMNQVVVSDKIKLSYGKGGIVSPIDITPVTDILGPSLLITSHVSNQIVGTSTITISGIASDSGYGNHGISQVTINGVRADNDTTLGKGTANWSKTIVLTSASTVFTIIAYDNFSVPNSTTKIITIITTADVGPPFTWSDDFSGLIDTEKWFLSTPPPVISDGKLFGSIPGGGETMVASGSSLLVSLTDSFSISIKTTIDPSESHDVGIYLFGYPCDPNIFAEFYHSIYGAVLKDSYLGYNRWAETYPIGYQESVMYLKITREGSSYAFMYSLDGVNWTTLITRELWSGACSINLYLFNYYPTDTPCSVDNFLFLSGEPPETPKAVPSLLFWGLPS